MTTLAGCGHTGSLTVQVPRLDGFCAIVYVHANDNDATTT
jgi:hypothetical protein